MSESKTQKALEQLGKKKLFSVSSKDPSPSKPLKASEKRELFNQIVEWIREQGCKVYVHTKQKTVSGSNGYFTPDPEPHIRIGMLGRPIDNAIVLLLHEFCHYWQWHEGFLGRKDDVGNSIYGKILDGEDVTSEERELASKLVRISEYDCEKRTAFLLKKWGLTSIRSVQDHIKYANSYNRHQAWSIGSRDGAGSGEFVASHEACADKLWPDKKHHRWLTLKELLAPISPKHKKVFDAELASKKRKS